MNYEILLEGMWYHLENDCGEIWWRWTTTKNVLVINTDEYDFLDILVGTNPVSYSRTLSITNDHGIMTNYLISSGGPATIISVDIKNTKKLLLNSETFLPEKEFSGSSDSRHLGFSLHKFTLRCNNKSREYDMRNVETSYTHFVFLQQKQLYSKRMNVLDRNWSELKVDDDRVGFVENNGCATIYLNEYPSECQLVMESLNKTIVINYNNLDYDIDLKNGINIINITFINDVKNIVVKSSIKLYEIFSIKDGEVFNVLAKNLKYV